MAGVPGDRFEDWIVWDDGDVLVVDKPSGVLSQGGPGAHGGDLVALARRALGSPRVAVLHRIDRNVSGLVILARSADAARVLSTAIQAGRVERVYEAVVRGIPKEESFVVDAPLRKDERTNEVTVGEGDGAKPARTEAHLVARVPSVLGRLSVLEVRPITGRSHQIRAHLRHVGLPIVGDPKYGVAARGLHRPLLHARAIAFTTAKGERVRVERAPPWTRDSLARLRK